MARVKQAELLTDETEDAVVYEVPRDEPQRLTDADQRTMEFLDKAASYGAEASIIIRKQADDGTDSMDYCERVPVDRFDFWQLHDYIARKYGGGIYRLFVTRKGTRGLLENILITISKQAEKIEAQKTGLNSGDPVMMRLIDAMDKLQQRVEQRIGGNAPVDPTEQMMKMLQMMQMMQSLQPKTTPMTDLLGFVKSVKEIGPMLGLGEGEKEDSLPWGQIISSALPALVGAMHQKPVRQVNPRARPVPPEPKVVNPKEDAKPMPNIEGLDPQHVAVLKPYIAQACTAAAFGASSEMVAEKIVEAIEQNPELEQLVMLPNVVDIIVSIDPDATKHKDWFADVVEWVKGHMGLPSKYSDEFDDGEVLAEPSTD